MLIVKEVSAAGAVYLKLHWSPLARFWTAIE
jgi:hypothetical protein